jgi:hypothetical protein
MKGKGVHTIGKPSHLRQPTLTIVHTRKHLNVTHALQFPLPSPRLHDIDIIRALLLWCSAGSHDLVGWAHDKAHI